MLALEDDASTSSYKMCIPCSDSVVTGMCSGNTDTSEDVRCGEEEAFLFMETSDDVIDRIDDMPRAVHLCRAVGARWCRVRSGSGSVFAWRSICARGNTCSN